MEDATARRVKELTRELESITAELGRLASGEVPPPARAEAGKASTPLLRRRRKGAKGRSSSVASEGKGDKATEGGDGAAAGEGAGAGPPAKSRRQSMDTDSAGTASEADIQRPSMYPHAPRTQLDSLESNKFEEIELLDALKLRTFEGFYNLAFIVLIASLGYMTARSINRHGLFLFSDIATPLCPQAARDATWIGGCVILSLMGTVVLFGCQVVFSRYHKMRVGVLWSIYGLFQALLLGCSTAFVYFTPISPMSAAAMLMWVVVLSMKVHSYVATNYGMHLEWEKKSRKPRSSRAYPNNVTFKNLAFFIAAPTLVYEAKYARSKRIRKRYVAKKLLQMAGCAGLQYFIMGQFMLPVLRGEPGRSSGFVLDLLKLAVPSFIMWLAGFYMLFHCLLNTTAELLRFSDRKFFEDWWNSTSLDTFWRKWNIPVHEWCLRHVYIESMHYAAASKRMATFATFLMSAILHELLFSVAFKTFKAWFFIGMLGQIPLIVVSRAGFLRGHRRGNFMVWLSLFMSQPVIELLYFRVWFTEHDTEFFCVGDGDFALTSLLPSLPW